MLGTNSGQKHKNWHTEDISEKKNRNGERRAFYLTDVLKKQ